jgi:hypothetical protein
MRTDIGSYVHAVVCHGYYRSFVTGTADAPECMFAAVMLLRIAYVMSACISLECFSFLHARLLTVSSVVA